MNHKHICKFYVKFSLSVNIYKHGDNEEFFGYIRQIECTQNRYSCNKFYLKDEGIIKKININTMRLQSEVLNI
jgi:hypothetical protein